MIKHNSYFENHVQSMALTGHEKPVTVGAMAVGDYEFATDAAEVMDVIKGTLIVLLPSETEWQTFETGMTFSVPANSRFKLKVPVDTAYLCTYG